MLKKWSEMKSFLPSDVSSDRSDDFPSIGDQLKYAWKRQKLEAVDQMLNWKPIVLEDNKPEKKGPGLGRRIISGLGKGAGFVAESYLRKKMQQKNNMRQSHPPQIPSSINKDDPDTIDGEFEVK